MADLHRVKQDLERKLALLTARVTRIQAHLRNPGPKDSQERASETQNERVLERLDESELDEIAQIRKALRRIDGGTYTVCAACGESIAMPRLEALPYTSVCIACAE